MIDINLLRSNPEIVKKSLINRNKSDELVDKVVQADTDFRNLLKIVEDLRSEQNKISKSFTGKPTPDQITAGKEIKEKLKVAENNLNTSQASLNSILEEIPNIPADDVPVGKDDTDNVVIKTVGEKPKFDFQPLDHHDLGIKLDIIDKEKAGQISGSRFGYYKNQGAILEMAIMFYTMKKLVAKGFHAMLPPIMIKSQTEWACGYASNKNLFNAFYSMPDDDQIFISSSEHSVVPYHSNEVLPESIFPIK
jgi:seryl-tRNA synthetase